MARSAINTETTMAPSQAVRSVIELNGKVFEKDHPSFNIAVSEIADLLARQAGSTQMDDLKQLVISFTRID